MLSTGLAEYYAQRAPEYEKVYAKPERQHDLTVLKGFLRDVFTGRDVLEIACGTGYWSEILAQSAKSVFATDINEEVLEIARAKRAITESARVTFARQDAFEIAAPATFNACLAAFWWSHIPRARLPVFLQALRSSLQPGAQVVFIDNRYVHGSSTPIHRTDEQGDSFQLRKLADGAEHEVLKNFPDREELIKAAEHFGANAMVDELQYYWILRYTLR